MLFTESSVNRDAEVSSDTSLSRIIYKEGLSRHAIDTNLASDAEAENTGKGKTSEHPSRFSAIDATREKHSKKQRFKADGDLEVSEKGDDEYADFKRFRAVPKHDDFK